PNGAPGKECRAVFALYSEDFRSETDPAAPGREVCRPPCEFDPGTFRGDRSSRAWSNGVGRTVLFYREKGKAEYSAGVGWEREGKRILFDIAGEAVEDTFEVILRMLLPFL